MKKTDLLLGVELEVEITDDPDPYAAHESKYVIYGSYPKHKNMGHIHKLHGNIIATADQVTDNVIQTHYDNTINDGVEWIGKPMTLAENKIAWNNLLEHEDIAPYIHGEDVEETKGNGYGTHDVGMHVHVSGGVLSPIVMGRLMVFINAPKNKLFIEFIAGRKLNRFCTTETNRKVEDGQLLFHSENCARISKRNKRITSLANGQYDVMSDGLGYCCVNGTKFVHSNFARGALWVAPMYGTGDFELRIFKSTVRPPRFNANLEFVVAIVDYCNETKTNDLHYKDFSEWMSLLKQRIKYTTLFKLMRKAGYTQGIVPKKETINEWVKSGKVKLEDIGVAA